MDDEKSEKDQSNDNIDKNLSKIIKVMTKDDEMTEQFREHRKDTEDFENP